MTEDTKPTVIPFHALTPNQRFGMRCLRTLHFLMARSGLFQATILLALLGERATVDKEPPIHPWIIYLHAFILMLTSTGLSTRLLPRASVYVYAAFQVHMAYIFYMTPALNYPLWLRVRSSLRSIAVAGASLRVFSTGTFSSSSKVDKFACCLLGFVSGILGMISMPLDIFDCSKFDRELQVHEQRSVISMFDCSIFHWLIGGLFFGAFLAYTFPVLVIPPKAALKNSQGTQSSGDSFLSKLTQIADKLSILAWVLLLAFKDLNWNYWQPDRVHVWMQTRLICDDVIVIASLIVGFSLPWLGEATERKQAEARTNKKMKST